MVKLSTIKASATEHESGSLGFVGSRCRPETLRAFSQPHQTKLKKSMTLACVPSWQAAQRDPAAGWSDLGGICPATPDGRSTRIGRLKGNRAKVGQGRCQILLPQTAVQPSSPCLRRTKHISSVEFLRTKDPRQVRQLGVPRQVKRSSAKGLNDERSFPLSTQLLPNSVGIGRVEIFLDKAMPPWNM